MKNCTDITDKIGCLIVYSVELQTSCVYVYVFDADSGCRWSILVHSHRRHTNTGAA